MIFSAGMLKDPKSGLAVAGESDVEEESDSNIATTTIPVNTFFISCINKNSLTINE